MPKRFITVLLLGFLLVTHSPQPAVGQQPGAPPAAQRARGKEDPKQRAKSLQSIAERLGVGSGSVIADIGAGAGRDTWVFANIVGETGKVFAEEIDEGKLQGIEKEVKKRELSQVQPVLGQTSDPLLPADTVDLAFMHSVYHHLSHPREMLQGIWKALKPGGHLVVVDQRLGTLVDWVPREERAKKHYWIAETTVVREAREQGFAFLDFAEEDWHAKAPFVLVFQRPTDLDEPDRDPDLPRPISSNVVQHLLPPPGEADRRVAFVALGEGRKLIEPILEAVPGDAVDVVLEEWATRKDERPPLPNGLKLPSVLTENGDPSLHAKPIGAVYFLDTYHLLFHGPKLLAEFRERLTPDGRV